MAGIVEQIKEKPWTGWALAGVILVGAVVMYIRLTSGADDRFTTKRMGEMVTIKYTDTDEEEAMTQGDLLKRMLRERNGSGSAQIDPTKGLLNPKTGKPTGFLLDRSTWDEIVKGANREITDANKSAPSAPKAPSAPTAPPAPKAQ